MAKVVGEDFDYIEHCKQVVAGIDVAQLEALNVERMTGRADHIGHGDTRTFSIGKLSVAGSELYIALKHDPLKTNRLPYELTDAGILCEAMPELFPKLPHFMGAITLKGSSKPFGLITEDATKNGQYPIHSAKLDQDLVDEVTKALLANRPPYKLIYSHFAMLSAFYVNGETRILDLAPSVIEQEGGEETYQHYAATQNKAVDTVDESLTVAISPDSPLAQSAREHRIL